MADGANKEFMKLKRKFLEQNIIAVAVASNQLEFVADHHADAGKAVIKTQGRLANRGQANQYAAMNGKTVGVYDFDLIKSTRKAKVHTTTLGIGHNTSVTVYELKQWGTKGRDYTRVRDQNDQDVFTYQTPARAHPIRAYWVDWSPDSCWSVQLGNAADYFFTPTMDGCSLSISSGASPVVTHGNYKKVNDPNRVSQGTTLNEINTHHTTTLGTDVNRSLRKNQYVATHAEKLQGINRMVTVVGFRDPVANTWDFYWQRRVDDLTNPGSKLILQDRMVLI